MGTLEGATLNGGIAATLNEKGARKHENGGAGDY